MNYLPEQLHTSHIFYNAYIGHSMAVHTTILHYLNYIHHTLKQYSLEYLFAFTGAVLQVWLGLDCSIHYTLHTVSELFVYHMLLGWQFRMFLLFLVYLAWNGR